MVKKLAILLLFCYSFIKIEAQVNCFANVAIDKHSVYAQEPFKATVTVSTATWYTAPLDFDNIQISNAFILPFSRTFSTMLTVNGKQYASLQFYFIVFPYKPGNYSFPAINIRVETPPLGSSTSQKVTINTSPQKFVVKDIPQKFKGENWFVAKNVYVSEHWNKSLNNLKVGDVLKRTVVIDAKGTLPQFIPGFKNDSLDWASVYPDDPDLADTRDDYDANGKRTQTITYLLEKEGTFEMPAINIAWWNPYASRLYKRSAAGATLHVKANPNLGMLTTLKDSLSAFSAAKEAVHQHKGALRIYGILWYWFLLYALIALCLTYVVVRMIIAAYKKIRQRRRLYVVSEPYWFKKFLSAQNKTGSVVNALYAWWDRWIAKDKFPSVNQTLQDGQDKHILEEMNTYNKEVYNEGNKNALVDKDFKTLIRQLRKERTSTNEPARQVDERQDLWEES
ncbi:BatD family protein [Danxiaibacter flavus]|uniref:BatD family protein n=1 Tax=Danxiaibacter flavus TaxID=3049108 RepID=A0ABV3ZAS4_9BACT|nr:BatD family protein [Chitinophagaceae bacterium DXS]